MSTLNAGNGPSHYLTSKGEGEARVHAFANLLRRAPGLFPLACTDTRFAPVWVGDVVAAYARTLDDSSTFGQRYPLCGPKVYRLQQLLQYCADTSGMKRLIIGLPDPLASLQAGILEWLPGKPFSLDNYRSLQVDSVCVKNGLDQLGIQASPLEAIVPTYLRQEY